MMESNLVSDYQNNDNTNNFAILVKEGTKATSEKQAQYSKQLDKITYGLGG